MPPASLDSNQLGKILTPRQARAVRLYARICNQKTTGRQMGISQAAVSKLLQAASARLSQRAGREVSVVQLVRGGITRNDLG